MGRSQETTAPYAVTPIESELPQNVVILSRGSVTNTTPDCVVLHFAIDDMTHRVNSTSISLLYDLRLLAVRCHRFGFGFVQEALVLTQCLFDWPLTFPTQALCAHAQCMEHRLTKQFDMFYYFVVFGGLSLGAGHTLILKPDATVWAAGMNTFGQLGIDSRGHNIMPNFVEVVPDGAKAVAAGGSHSLVLKQDGSVWATGRNAFGQLGDGLNTGRQSFVRVIPAYTEAVAAGARHSLVVMRDGGVWTTGYNLYGQLGDGSRTHRNIFVSVIGGGDAVAAGGEHSIVLKKDGSVWMAGLNSRGQLGDGSDRLKTTFVQVIPRGCKAIAAGSYHSMVLKQDGSVWATGGNTYGQLGDRTTSTRTTFVQVVARSVEAISFEMAVSSRVQAIAAGHDHSMVLKQDGSVWVTGRNNFGQLGEGTRRSSDTFVEVISGGVQAVAAGDWHSMVLKHDGSLWATGSNLYGQVGDGSTIIKSTFMQVLSSRVGTWYMMPLVPVICSYMRGLPYRIVYS